MGKNSESLGPISDIGIGSFMHATSVSDNFEQSLYVLLGFPSVRLLLDCRNGKCGQGWERKYVVLEGNKVFTYETEPREGTNIAQ